MLLILFSASSTLLSTDAGNSIDENPTSVGSRGGNGLLRFTEASSGLPGSGEYNFIALGDFNNDEEIDITFGGEDWTYTDTVGLYAFAGDGGKSWTSKSSGLATKNSWGGIALGDADSDGAVEIYATDEHWGSSTNSGLKAYEYRGDSWSDSVIHVSTPMQIGQPNNVVLKDITGSSALDLVICQRTGLDYYENGGGNPVNWIEKSTGLPTSREFTGISVEDINDDGLLDIISADYTGSEYIFIQSSSGDPWQDYSSSINSGGISLGVAVGDVNDDSYMDLIFGIGEGGLRCWLGNGGGSSGTDFTWTNASAGLPLLGSYNQIQLVDIDGDSDLDIISPEGVDQGMQIYLGNGNTDPGNQVTWILAKKTNLPTTGSWYGSNCYDINGDGALDIIGASWGMGVRVWLNNIYDEVEYFNLKVTEQNIDIFPDPPMAGSETEIKVKIRNDDEADAFDFTVGVYVDEQLLGSVEHYDKMEAYGQVELIRTWTPEIEGPHAIKVEIIPSDEELDSEPFDNIVIISVEVSSADDGNDNDSESGREIYLWIVIILTAIVIMAILLLTRRGRKTEAVEVLEDPDSG